MSFKGSAYRLHDEDETSFEGVHRPIMLIMKGGGVGGLEPHDPMMFYKHNTFVITISHYLFETENEFSSMNCLYSQRYGSCCIKKNGMH